MNKFLNNISYSIIKEVLFGILVLSSFLGLVGYAGYIENHYSIKATVVEVNDDEVIFCDTTGSEWIVFADNYTVGNKATLIFNTNYTDSRYDDEVVNLKRD